MELGSLRLRRPPEDGRPAEAAGPSGAAPDTAPADQAERERFMRSLATRVKTLEVDLDTLAAHARAAFDVPLCVINIVDRGEVRWEVRSGRIAGLQPPAGPLCSCSLCEQGALLVQDVADDERIRFCSWIRASPHLRFHARTPLTVGGDEVGRLCLFDTKPHRFPDRSVVDLERVASMASSLMLAHGESFEARATAEALGIRLKLAEEQARQASVMERRRRQGERLAKIGTWTLDVSSARLTWSDEIYRIFELPPGTPMDLARVRAFLHPSSLARHEAVFETIMTQGGSYDETFEIFGARGTHKWVRSIAELEIVGTSPSFLFGSVQDVSDAFRETRRLQDLAHHDALTGLVNRHRFDELWDTAIKQTGVAPGLLMIDIDRLKLVNDAYGHDAGDALIRIVAHRLKSVVGERGVACRHGGDEFVVLVHGVATTARLTAIAGDIQRATAVPFEYRGHTIEPSVTIGGSVDAGRHSVERLRTEADRALYRAKRKRRGSVMVARDA